MGSSLSSARWAVPHGAMDSMPALLTEKQREATVAVYTDAIKGTTRAGQTWEDAVRAEEASIGCVHFIVHLSPLPHVFDPIGDGDDMPYIVLIHVIHIEHM